MKLICCCLIVFVLNIGSFISRKLDILPTKVDMLPTKSNVFKLRNFLPSSIVWQAISKVYQAVSKVWQAICYILDSVLYKEECLKKFLLLFIKKNAHKFWPDLATIQDVTGMV